MAARRLRRPSWWLTIAVVLLGGLMVIGVAHNARLYHQPIVRITKVNNERAITQRDEFQNDDRTVTQKLSGVVLNTTHRGQHVTMTNVTSLSGAEDQRYHVGSQVFISTPHRGQQPTISGMKRDVVIALLAWLVVSLLLLGMQFSGLMAIVSVSVNAVLFFAAINLQLSLKNGNVFVIFSFVAVLFAALTLWLVLGWRKQTLITLIATLSGTALSIIISLIVFAVTHQRGMHYEGLQYVTTLPRPLFLAETLIGSLGAVMDESTDIVATLFELHNERPDLSRQQLFVSGRNVGRSIMGPLINVLFLIFVADTFPLTLLYLKNGNNWGYTYRMNMSMGVFQSLISGLGIVLAIPVASFVASRLMKKEQTTNDNV
ncbi:YibE/F family protein [Furfurilactobacillus sp. WILCCON 0119]